MEEEMTAADEIYEVNNRGKRVVTNMSYLPTIQQKLVALTVLWMARNNCVFIIAEVFRGNLCVGESNEVLLV